MSVLALSEKLAHVGRWLGRRVRRLWATASLDGAPPPLAYQPQHLWSDGTFDMWANIGEPTISKRVTRTRLELFRSVHPDAQLRVLQITSRAKVATEFSPNTSSQRTRHPMPDHQQTEAPTQEQRPGSL